tara:strand:- start:277 stop:483 length:207 start_codon:yes stop_codon:yes gene_type:complete
MSKDKERYIFLLFGCLALGKQIHKVFFTDYVAVTWFEYVGVFGITFLMMLFTFIYYDKIIPYFEKKGE